MIQPRPFSKLRMLKISRAADAGERRTDRARAAGQQRAADHDRGDGEQLPADAFGRLARAELRGQDHAGQPGERRRTSR